MEKSIITFSANEQNLQKTGGIGCYASDTVSYIEAHFALGGNWSGYDSIRAVWFNDYKTLVTVLNPNGICIVPHEVLVSRGKVMVNLVGSVLVSDELSDRLTTFPCEALTVARKAKINGSETAPITPSLFEQYVAVVKADADRAEESATNAGNSAQSASNSAESAHNDKIAIEQDIAEVIQQIEDFEQVQVVVDTLPAGSQATSDFTDGVLTLGIPQGAKGDTGNGIASITKTGTSGLVDTYTITYTNGQTTTFTVTNGAKGDTGNGIASIEKTSTDGLVDTYTITYTNGTTTTFTVTNGEKGDKGDTGEVSQAEFDEAVSNLKSDYSELKEYVGVKDYGLLGGYVFEKASGNTTVTVVDTQTGVQLTKSDAVNANCRFRPTSWVKGQYNVKGSFSSGSITQLQVYENGSLITTIPVTDKEFAFAYEWDGSKRVQFGFQYPYNVGTLLFELNVYDAVSIEDRIKDLGELPPFIIGETNTFFGVDSGKNTAETPINETDDGRYNAAFGTEAMKANTTGDHCTAVGYKALAKNTSGDSNTGLGEDALYENTTGEYNVAVGGHALQNNNGSSNTAVGSNAGRNVSTGTGNVIIGSQAGQNVIGGSQNVLIGSYVGQGAGDYSDTVVIGNDINPSANHQVKIGGSNITSLVVRMNNKNMLISFNEDGTITWS